MYKIYLSLLISLSLISCDIKKADSNNQEGVGGIKLPDGRSIDFDMEFPIHEFQEDVWENECDFSHDDQLKQVKKEMALFFKKPSPQYFTEHPISSFKHMSVEIPTSSCIRIVEFDDNGDFVVAFFTQKENGDLWIETVANRSGKKFKMRLLYLKSQNKVKIQVPNNLRKELGLTKDNSGLSIYASQELTEKFMLLGVLKPRND